MTLKELRDRVDDLWSLVPWTTEVEIRVSRPAFEDTKARPSVCEVETKNGLTLVVIQGQKT